MDPFGIPDHQINPKRANGRKSYEREEDPVGPTCHLVKRGRGGPTRHQNKVEERGTYWMLGLLAERLERACVLNFFFSIFFFFSNSAVQFLKGEYNPIFDLIVLLLSTAFLLLFLYLKNNYYLREQEQRDKLQIARLQQQYAYYQEKQKDE